MNNKKEKPKPQIAQDYPYIKYTPSCETPYENMCFMNFNTEEDTDFKFD